MYCTPVGLDGGGAGPGAMWGTELATQMLAAAGFGQVEVLDSPVHLAHIYAKLGINRRADLPSHLR